MWKRWIPLFILALMAVGVVWFWFLGALPVPTPSSLSVREVQGSAEVRAVGKTAWEALSVGRELSPGDTVRTGSGSSLTLSFYDGGETHLDEKTELTVVEARRVGADEDEVFARLRLATGRAWTRVLNLVDVAAGVSIETPEAVATVRGTSFDVATQEGKTTVWVADSVVDMDAGALALLVPEGRMASFGRAATGSVEVIGTEAKSGAWFRDNRARDAAFSQEQRDRWRKASGVDRVSGGRTMQQVMALSERMHQRFGSTDIRMGRGVLSIVRRLLLMRRTAEAGKSGLAYQDWARFEGEMKSALAQPSDDTARQRYRRAFALAVQLYADVRPDDVAYRIKQDVEEARLGFATTPDERLAVELAAAATRLGEGRDALGRGNAVLAKQMVSIADQSMGNAMREGENQDMPEAARRELVRRHAALVARLEALKEDADAMDQVLHPPAIVLPSISTTSTATTTEPVVTTSTPPAPPAVHPVSIGISPAQATVAAFGSVAFSVRAQMSDGTVRDVTNMSKYSLSDLTRGSVVAGRFTAGQVAGPVRITVTIVSEGKPLTATCDINVNP